MTTSEVGSYVRNRIYGFRNSKFKEDGEEYDIIVRLDEKYRSSLTEIENILIIDGHGEKIRLKNWVKSKSTSHRQISSVKVNSVS